jgi:hypothetical protein
MPMLGSIVQKGKLLAAIICLVRALNRVDLPTFGRPTIPQERLDEDMRSIPSKVLGK